MLKIAEQKYLVQILPLHTSCSNSFI